MFILARQLNSGWASKAAMQSVSSARTEQMRVLLPSAASASIVRCKQTPVATWCECDPITLPRTCNRRNPDRFLAHPQKTTNKNRRAFMGHFSFQVARLVHFLFPPPSIWPSDCPRNVCIIESRAKAVNQSANRGKYV